MGKITSRKLAIVGMGIALNSVGAFIALAIGLPIYLDSIGTIMVAFLLGPIYGITTGLLGSLISGLTFDVFALYFAPVQIFTGFFAGYFYKKDMMRGAKIYLSVFIMTIFVGSLGAIIAAYVFEGQTSSNSSYILQFLRHMGVPLVVSSFITQFITDYLDKLIGCILMLTVIKRIPSDIKRKIVS